MINKCKKQLTIALIFIFSLFGQAFVQAETNDPTLKKVQDRGVLTVGLSADYAPY